MKKPAAMGPPDPLHYAQDPETTPFDYIVVGSGAGGGSLAARLALEGRRVLVLEAGVDPGTGEPMTYPKSAPLNPGPDGVGVREVYAVPAYNGASTEELDISWKFSVRHFADRDLQLRDRKYDPLMDLSRTQQGAARGGIFYPRSSALGGCTAHHAMIMVRPNDSDWDRIALSTGDQSWHSENMQGYFAKLEDCLYYKVYRGFFGWFRWLFALINPRAQLEPGGHGFAGWQTTSFVHPALILGIVKKDCTFLRILFGVLRSALADKQERRRLLRALLHFEIVQVLDPNVRSPDFPTRASRMSLIPIGTDGASRRGLREHLLDVANSNPDRLSLLTGAHAMRVVFTRNPDDGLPRAIGVEVAEGLHLYGASPLSEYHETGKPKQHDTAQYFARCEVILCGGTFNTPQLLMLSGIGDEKHLQGRGIKGPRDHKNRGIAPGSPPIHLPGVGANLQDRYEVSVISETREPFSVLRGASFQPGDANDPVRRQWECEKTGLYTTNGGAVAMLLSSEASVRAGGEPDLFVFGVPAAFRGYYWGWSEELLRRRMRRRTDPLQRNLWTWLILKAYTHNDHGTVRLLSDDWFVPPEIIFNSFQNGRGNADDIAALCEAVRKVRGLNERIGVFTNEIQPGARLRDGSPLLAVWLQRQAWGHHACGTCRIGSDPWRPDVTNLCDRNAVVDSKFRVYGVHGLRVVDASVFPRIPGYFLVSSVFMIGEKAADVLLADSRAYPSALEQAEAAAVRARRAAARPCDAAAASPPELAKDEPVAQACTAPKLPADAVGLALSGGGIRSATFCLGVLQALAKHGKLRNIDFLSTVSGGGFAGGFLGRLFTRLATGVNDAVQRVQQILADAGSAEIWWLRKNADYIASAGIADVETNLAILLRNLVAAHFVVGALLFGLFGALRWLADKYGDVVQGLTIEQLNVACDACGELVLRLSVWHIVWWWVPVAVLVLAVLPLAIGYWLTPGAGQRYPRSALLLWGLLLAGAVYGLGVPGAAGWSALAVAALLFGWLTQEATRWRVAYQERGTPADAATDSSPDSVPNALVRSRVTRSLGAALLLLAVSILWVVLDSLARFVASPAWTWAMLGSLPLVVLLRIATTAWLKGAVGTLAEQWSGWARKAIVAGLAYLLAGVLLFFLDVLVHLAFDADKALPGLWITSTAVLVSLLAGRWFGFLNLSSLQQAYGQKLVRTFLGASNDARVHPVGPDDPVAVEIPNAGDDVYFDDYHPERNGGPLHLVNTCVNDTVAGSSGRQLRDDKGLSMCVGPEGLSVGLRYHALWGRRNDVAIDESIVRPLPVAPDPNAFHVFARSDDKTPAVERLRLGQWMGISGAAVSTGTGRFTNVPQALLLGLLNVRLGYWWDSGIRAGRRPGRYPPNLWRRLKSFPASIFRMQATLLNEWRGYFPGPAERLWYLTDGGHFDNTGLYELFRRRLAFVIAIDGGEDQEYNLDDLAILARQVRLDFDGEIEWLDPTGPRSAGYGDWAAFDQAARPFAQVPPLIRSLVNANALGALAELRGATPETRRNGLFCSALARVAYDGDRNRPSWLLLLKANLAPSLPVDVTNYAALHSTFPNESTADQFFRDDQWESYRVLGERAGAMVFAKP
jgi:choline dehydrogenase-like flavoprotein